MSCCCTKIYRICDVVICDDEDLELPIPAPADGEFTLELDFLGNTLRRTAQGTSEDNLRFAKGDLNENFTYVGRVTDVTGNPVTFTIGEVEYDCVEFTTKRDLTWSTASSSASDSPA